MEEKLLLFDTASNISEVEGKNKETANGQTKAEYLKCVKY